MQENTVQELQDMNLTVTAAEATIAPVHLTIHTEMTHQI